MMMTPSHSLALAVLLVVGAAATGVGKTVWSTSFNYPVFDNRPEVLYPSGDLLVSANRMSRLSAKDGSAVWHAGESSLQVDTFVHDTAAVYFYVSEEFNGKAARQNTTGRANQTREGAIPTQLYAVNIDTGAVLWKKSYAHQLYNVNVTVSSSTVVISTGTQLIGLDKATGTQMWAHTFFVPSGRLAGVTTSAGHSHFVGVGLDHIIAVRDTGVVDWITALDVKHHQCQGQLSGHPIYDPVSSQVFVFDDNHVFNGYVWALNFFTGAVNWAVDLKDVQIALKHTRPLVLQGRLIFMGSDLLPGESAFALDVASGAVAWKIHFDINVAENSVVRWSDTEVVLVGANKTVIADASTGAVKVTVAEPANIQQTRSTFSMSGRLAILYIKNHCSGGGTSNNLIYFDVQGSKAVPAWEWEYRSPNTMFQIIAIDATTVYFVEKFTVGMIKKSA